MIWISATDWASYCIGESNGRIFSEYQPKLFLALFPQCKWDLLVWKYLRREWTLKLTARFRALEVGSLCCPRVYVLLHELHLYGDKITWCFVHVIYECKNPFFQFVTHSFQEDIVSSLPSPMEDDSLFVISQSMMI
jgi:hypothetical protein